MRPGKLAAGHSRKRSLAGRIREGIKRFLSVAVSVSVIACSMPAIPVMAAEDEDDVDVQEITMTVNDLCDAVEKALQEDEPISESAYVFAGEAQETYEDLFYGADVYEIEPEYEMEKSKGFTLKTFVRLSDDRELDSAEITGGEEIIFLLLNNTKEEVAARIMIDDYETGLITVAAKGDVATEGMAEEEADIATLSAGGAGSAAAVINGEDPDKAEEAEEAEEAEKAEDNADADDAESAEEAEKDVPEPDDRKDPAPKKDEDNRPDDKGRDHESGKETDPGDKGGNGAGSEDKPDPSEPDDKDDRGFTGGSHDKGDKADKGDQNGSADRNDPKDKADKADKDSSNDSGDKADKKDDGSAKSSRTSRSSNPLKAALNETEDEAEDDAEIIIEIEEDDDAIVIEAGDEEADGEDVVEDSEVTIASASDADKTLDGYILIDGETYEAVVVNGSRTGVAYVTSFEALGINYGIKTLATEGTCGDNLTWVLDDDGVLTISGEGDMYDWDSASETPWYEYIAANTITSVVIEEGVTSVGAHAFDRAYNIETVEFPDSLTSIGFASFWGAHLNGDSMTMTVAPGAAIVTRTGNGDTSETKDTLMYTGSVVVIPDSVTYIGDSAFEYAYTEYFIIGSGLTSFDGVAFASYYLEGIIIENDKSNVEIKNQENLWKRLTGNSANNDVFVIYCNEVETSIGKCGDNLDWDFNNGVLTISGTGDMYSWNSASEAPWYDIRTEITSVVIEDGVTTIGGHAFEGASNLTSVEFGSTLVSIGTWAFCYDYNLQSVDFPDTLTTIEDYAFYGCDLTGNVLTTTVEAGAAVVKESTGDVTTETEAESTYTGSTVVIPDSVTSVGSGAFGTTHPEYFVIGKGLVTFDGSAFASHYLKAVLIDNYKNNITINNQSSLWGNLWVENDVEIVYMDGETAVTVETAAQLKTYLQANKGAANYYETIILAKDIEVTSISANDEITVGSKHTLDLNGHTINIMAEGYYTTSVYIAVSTTETFTVRNGTIDGSEAAHCAAISAKGALTDYSEKRNLVLENVTFKNFPGNGQSRSSTGHAVVYVTYGDLTVENCTFENNDRSAIYVSGHGTYYDHGSYGTITIKDSTFTKNDSIGTGSYSSSSVASNSTGGAIRIEGDVDEVSIEDCIFTQNNAAGRGAGLYVTEVNGDLTIKGNEFSKNTITLNNESDPNGGAGVFIGNVKGDLLFSGNNVSNNTLVNTGLNNNLRNYGGGVLYHDSLSSHSGNSYVFENNTITDNVVEDGHAESKGGGISVGGVNDPDQVIEITSGTVSGNKADFGAGIDYSYEGAATLKLYNAIITDNTAGISGGGFWACPAATTTLNQTYGGTIYGNTADTMADTIRFEGVDGIVYPGLSGGTFVSVNPRALGGTLIDWYTDDDGARRDEAVDVVTDDRFHDTNLSFSLYGGLSDKGIELAEAEATLYITGNEAYSYGGGMASNSPVEFGDESYKKLTVIKKWIDDQGNEITTGVSDESIKVKLIRISEEGTRTDLEIITLNEDNDWTHTFTDLPSNYDYDVREVPEAAYGSPDDYVWSQDEDGYPVVTMTNDKKEGLVIGKQVNGSTLQNEFSFKITLKDSEGNPIIGDINIRYYMDSGSDIMADRTGILEFDENGEAEVTLVPDEYINLTVPYGTQFDVEELLEEVDKDKQPDQTYVSLNGSVTKATSASGTVEDSTEVIFINSYREYYDIDEEIIPGMDDANNRSSWEKSTSVTEYGALEFEMSTFLPKVVPDDVYYGEFTMLFHNKLDEGLLLDADEESDLHITIGGKEVPTDYYDVDVLTKDVWTIAPLSIVDNEDCTFHVTVDLSRLYRETDIVNDEDLTGNTEMIIYFYVDLEGQSMDGSYKSVVQYQIFDEDELLYTSSESTVYVYTYEIGINKSSSANGAALGGATFGVYYDEACTQPVTRYGENYTVTSDENGKVLFYGLAAGTYYLKELEAPSGYVLTQDVYKVIVGEEQVNISGSTSMSDDELDGAEFEVYYDEECEQRVSVDGEYYNVRSDSDGNIIFDGLAAGTYYLKGVKDSEGNDISSVVIPVTLDYDTFTYGYDLTVSNTPETTTTTGGGGGRHGGGGGSSGGGSGAGGPGSGEGDSGEAYYPLEPMPETGDPGLAGPLMLMIFGFVALVAMVIYDRKKKHIND